MALSDDKNISPEYLDKMNGLASELDRVFNGQAKGPDREVGFVLLVFPFGGGEGRCNYISNAHRTDVVTLLKEMVARFEGQPEIKGHA